jgi:type IV pilus assembly protein PilB
MSIRGIRIALLSMEDKKLKEILLTQNYLSKEDIEAAEKYARSHKTSFLDYLFAEKLLSRDILGQAVAEYFAVPYIDLSEENIDNEVFMLIPELVARSKGVIAFARTEDKVKLGMTNPDDLAIKHLIEKRVGQQVIPYYITEHDLDETLARYQSSLKDKFDEIVQRIEDETKTRDERDDLIVKVVDTLMQYGYENNASDIHIEPYSKKILVRFRIDGILHDVLEIPKKLADFITTRIKILSKMRTDEHRAAQDGKFRFHTEYAGSKSAAVVDVRVSVVPVTEGENVVLRLLSSKNRMFSLTDLGLSGADLKKVKKAIKDPHGMILVTGPTGSGKTTTLYAVMKILNKRDVHISTIEDPVEYDIEGISQIQVNTKTQLTFAKGLRAIVRQDPDIIMVGEIRDEETSGIAVNSALTGHLVLSTLHTNDAATTLPRLLDMGVEPFLVASTVNVVIAQRLVRKVCGTCRTSYEITTEEKKIIENNPHIINILKNKGKENLDNIRLYKGKGCKVCANTGYAGRMGIFEVLEMAENIKELILKNASSDEITAVAVQNGMTTMLEDGVDKVLHGITTLPEVLRVARG